MIDIYDFKPIAYAHMNTNVRMKRIVVVQEALSDVGSGYGAKMEPSSRANDFDSSRSFISVAYVRPTLELTTSSDFLDYIKQSKLVLWVDGQIGVVEEAASPMC